MKKKFLFLTVSMFIVGMALALTGCGGPKSLAKQTYDLYQQVLSVQDDPVKAAALRPKVTKLSEKMAKLSEKDQIAFAKELAYLGGADMVAEFGLTEAAVSAAAIAPRAGAKVWKLSKPEDFQYDLTQIDGTDYVIIKGYNGNWSDEFDRDRGDTFTINIPEKIEGYTVGAIGEKTFENKLISSITLPDTVMVIGPSAFAKLKRISSVKLPKSLREIGASAFAETGLTSITLPAGLQEIGASAFAKTGLTSVTLPAGLKKIGYDAFRESQIGSVTIPNGITEIAVSVFANCKKLREVTIPDSVTVIGDGIFAGCTELTTVNLPSHPVEYTKNTGWYNDDVITFRGCTKLSLAMRKKIQDSGYSGPF